MPRNLDCPGCSIPLSVPDEFAGRTAHCPKCRCAIPPADSRATPPQEPEAGDSEPSTGLRVLSSQRFTCGACKEPITADQHTSLCTGETQHRVHTECASVLCGGRCPECGFAIAPPKPTKPPRARPVARPTARPVARRTPARRRSSRAATVLLGMIALILLGCCGWGINAVIQKFQDESGDKSPSRVTAVTYGGLEVGNTPHIAADAQLGTGRVATGADLPKVFANEPLRAGEWASKVSAGRAVVWQNGDDYIIAAFHPSTNGTGRLQAKAWCPKHGRVLQEGELDDTKFLQRFPPSGPGLPVTAAELAQAYKGTTTAETKYRNRLLSVNGTLVDLVHNSNEEPMVVLEGVPMGEGRSLHVRVQATKADEGKLLSLSRGQPVRLKGRCTGLSGIAFVDLVGGTFESAGADPNPTVSASDLLAEYARGPFGTDFKYKEKALTVTGAVVEKKESDTALIASAGPLGGLGRIRVTVPFDAAFQKQLSNLKAGDRIRIKGEYRGSSSGVITLDRAWLAP